MERIWSTVELLRAERSELRRSPWINLAGAKMENPLEEALGRANLSGAHLWEANLDFTMQGPNFRSGSGGC